MISVMVVDDSPLFRQVFAELLGQDPEIGEVITAANGEVALSKLARSKPDVITMDLEMPGMGGIATIEKIMATHPIPIVVISASARDSAELSLRAIEMGAVDVIEKPGGAQSAGIGQMREYLAATVKNAASVRLVSRNSADVPHAPAKGAYSPESDRRTAVTPDRFQVVAVGASTGGPIALKEVLLGLPAHFPVGMVVVQHMPAGFTSAYAKRLDSICPLKVKEARDGDEITAATVLISPGDMHLKVVREGKKIFTVLDSSEKVNKHRPSVDVLMHSVADVCGKRALGLIMTGMGRDGARGFADLHARGGYVIAQDEASSVIYGMNKAVVENKTYDEVVALDAIAGRLARLTASKSPGKDKK